MGEAVIGVAVGAELRQDTAGGAADDEGHAELEGRCVERVVCPVVQVPVDDGVRAEEAGHETELADGAPQLLDGSLDALQR